MRERAPTKRRTLAHVSICVGCCCGRVDKGHPEVPTEWLKGQWKTRKLAKDVHLSISGCLGPCDISNVVSIGSAQGVTWLGLLHEADHYIQIVGWATDVAREQRLVPLPAALEPYVFERFRAAAVAVLEEYE